MKKIMLITGASRGIGAATAILAARQGFSVCVNYAQRADAALQTVNTIQQQGGEAIAVQADVAQEADVERLFATCDAKLGAVTALVNNAGILEHAMPLEKMELARWQRVFAVNVMGSFMCSRAAIKRMSTLHGGAGGTIVNLSSAAARLGSPNEFIDYAASKGAIDSLTIGLSKEVAAQGIRVNAVRPGIIDTEIHASSGQPDRVAKFKQAVPMLREGSAAEVAEAILWLSTEQSSYTTGILLDVTGGR